MTALSCPPLRLRATITIDSEAMDYREAAVFQERVERHFGEVSRAFEGAEVVVKERRGRLVMANGQASETDLDDGDEE